MTNSSRLSALCDKIIEAGWIAAVVLVPLFFDIYSSRVFEPDKLTLLRSIALVMVAAWIVRTIEEYGAARRAGGGQLSLTNGVDRRTPLVLPTLVLSIVYVVATILSITPYTSLLGSYQRLQGTYTTFSYVVVFFMLLQGMRRRRQLDRLVTAIVMTSMPIAFYGLLQRGDGINSLDPLPWGGDVVSRVAANMGNAIFVAAYMIMAFFLTLGRVVEAFRVILMEEESRWSDILRASAYIFVGAVQLIGFSFANSRGPLLGWLPGMFIFWLVGLLLLRVALQNRPSDAAPPASDSVPEPQPSSSIVEMDVLKAIALSFTSIAAAGATGYLVYRGFPSSPQPQITLAAVTALIAGLVPLLVVAGIQRRAARWLWASWIFFSIVGAVGVFLVNFSDLPQVVEARRAGTFGSLGNLFESEGGTGRVRTLIWQGAVNLIRATEPITYPDGTADALSGLRPIIGYGPESMYVAYNKFYPPDLAHYEARNASPDRSHNETLDSFVVTGAVGFVAEQFLFVSVFFFSLKFVGWVPSRRAAIAFIGMMFVGGTIGAIGLGLAKGANFMGTGWPGGVTAGLVGYVTLFALFHFRISTRVYALISVLLIAILDLAIFFSTFTSSNRAVEIAAATLGGLALFTGAFLFARWVFEPTAGQPVAMSGHVFLIVALFGGMLSHYLEISLAGIAIASTRTYFWTFAALLVVTGLNWVPADDIEPAAEPETRSATPQPVKAVAAGVPQHKKRKPSSQPPTRSAPRPSIKRAAPNWVGPTIAMGLIGALILATLGYEFINLPPQPTSASLEQGPTVLIWNSLTTLPYDRVAPGRASPGTLLMFAVTWIFGTVISLTELRRRGVIKPDTQVKAVLLYTGVSLGGAFVYGLIQGGLLLGIFAKLVALNSTPADSLNHLVGRYVDVAETWAGLLGMFYVIVFATMLGLAFSLLDESRSRGLPFASEWGAISSLPVFAVAVVLLISTNFNAIRADIIFKQGQPWYNNNACSGAPFNESTPIGQCDVAIAHLKQALQHAPQEDFYMLSLGASYLNKSAAAPTAAEGPPSILVAGSTYSSIVNLDAERTAYLSREDALTAARVTLENALKVNPLNTDHSANLARLHRRWSDLAADDDERQLRLAQAGDYYRQATTLSPHNAQLWNEWAIIDFSIYELAARLRDQANANATTLEAQNELTAAEGARREAQARQAQADAALQDAEARLNESLALDQLFSDTYIYLASLYSVRGQASEVQAALRKALEVNPASPDAWGRLTESLLATGNYTDAEKITLDFVNRDPGYTPAWRMLAQRIYLPQGLLAQTLEAAQRAVDLSASNGDSNLWQDQFFLADVLRIAGEYGQALTYAQAALQAAPEDRKADVQRVLDAIVAAQGNAAPGPTP